MGWAFGDTEHVTWLPPQGQQPILTFCFKNVLPYFDSRFQEALPTYAAHTGAPSAPAFNVRYQASGENKMP